MSSFPVKHGSFSTTSNLSTIYIGIALNARVSGINIGANTSFSLLLFLSQSFGPSVNRAPEDLPWPARVPRNAEVKLLWDPSLAIMTNASFLLLNGQGLSGGTVDAEA